MREPTSEEMIEGIARGFEQFLKDCHPYGPLGADAIAKAISEGGERTFDKKEANK